MSTFKTVGDAERAGYTTARTPVLYRGFSIRRAPLRAHDLGTVGYGLGVESLDGSVHEVAVKLYGSTSWITILEGKAGPYGTDTLFSPSEYDSAMREAKSAIDKHHDQIARHG